MKKKLVNLICTVLVMTMVAVVFTACGKSTVEPTAEPTAEPTQAADETGAAGDGTIESLVASVADEDAFMILQGVADYWAPTVMVLLNDGTFYCLVDYAGQAVVNFCPSGEYVKNEDGSITATGALYTDGSELVYQIANDNGTYTVSVSIPDTEATAVLTGTTAK